jgi:hypothetical protein
MPAAVFAAISPFPPFPPILLFLLLAPADAPRNETKTPTNFRKTHPKKSTGNSERRTVVRKKGARIPVEIGFGAYDLGGMRRRIGARGPRDCKRRRVLVAGVWGFLFPFYLGFFLSVWARVYTRREKFQNCTGL